MSDFLLPAYGWKPRKDQVPIWNKLLAPNFRRGSLVAHRRYGKDELGLQTTAVKAMQRVGSYGYMLPEYAQARRAIWDHVNWRTGRTRIDDAFPPEIVTKRDNQSMMLWLESGSTVQLLGSDSFDSIVGAGYAGLVLSEAALADPRAMQFFRPMLEESGGWELQISTPRGKNHFYRAHLGATEDSAKDPTVFAMSMAATGTGVFPAHQLHRIKTELIREHGSVMGTAMFEQEYMCSFDAAVVGAVWGAELTELEMTNRVRPCPHDRRFPVQTSWDLGVADATAILFWQEVNGQYRLIDAYEGTGIGLDTYVKVLREKHNMLGYHFASHLAPHDIQQREWVRGLSRMDEAKRMGLIFTRTPQTKVKTQIAAGAQLIRQMVVNSDSPEAMTALEKFKGWRYPYNKATGQVMEAPLHDHNSHSSSALCTFAVNVASKLGMGGFVDQSLHSAQDDLGGTAKFDPRQFGSAPFGRDNNVSSIMRAHAGGQPTRGAFG